jgi:hypothetical protein
MEKLIYKFTKGKKKIDADSRWLWTSSIEWGWI